MVYFITQGVHYVKIGHCGGDPKSRLITLQTGNPNRLELSLLLEGGKEDETIIHGQFLKYHIRGEWYYLTLEIEDYISCHKDLCLLDNYKSCVPLGSGAWDWVRKGRKGNHGRV